MKVKVPVSLGELGVPSMSNGLAIVYGVFKGCIFRKAKWPLVQIVVSVVWTHGQ